jgi:MFS family permease
MICPGRWEDRPLSNVVKSRWWIVFLLFTGTFVNAIDRGSISTAVPYIMDDLKIDGRMMGVILSSFFWAYMVLNVPTGLLADRLGAKGTLGWSAFVWSMFSALTGLAARQWQLLVFRMGVGAGEAAVMPVSTRVVKAHFSTPERATAAGWYLCGFRLGFALSPLIMTGLINTSGWRHAFLITGTASLAWVALWSCTYWENGKNEAAPVSGEAGVPWSRLLRHRSVAGLVLCKFFQDYSYYLFVTWLPAYLIQERGFTLIKSGWYTSLPWIAAFLFQPVAGGACDWLVRRGMSTTLARKGCIVAMQLLAAIVVIAGYVDSVVVAVCLLVMSVAFESGSSVILWTVCAEIAPDGVSASVAGIMNTAGAMAGIVAPIITGWSLMVTGSFRIALLVGGCMFVLGALSMWFIVGPVEPMMLCEALAPEAALAGLARKN